MKFIYIISFFLPFLLAQTIFADNARISLDFNDLDTKAALQSLAKSANINMIISDQVKGKLTLNLQDIIWQQALQTILTSQNLGSIETNHIWYIAPTEQIISQQKEKEALQDQAPLATDLIHLQYAQASDLQKSLQNKSMLSNRGKLDIDQRTNSIIIQDIPSNINIVASIIKQLDVPQQEILIKARIVSVDSDYEKELGIRYNLTNQTMPISNEKKNLPLAKPNNSNNSGLALFPITSSTTLDLQLAALQADGHANIISSPELVASNEQAAVIEAGQEIPYQEKASQGATSVTFKKAVLSLQVTPQVISKQEILLHLDVHQDQRSSKEVLGVPTIDTRQISTLVLVKNGKTVVLGGIYEDVNSNHVDKVPFLSNIPVAGYLFQQHRTTQAKRELLIFVTPELIS